MSIRGLASLAKILEEASNPDSVVREDRPRRKVVLKKGDGEKRAVDPKRKAWYDKRLRESAKKEATAAAAASAPVMPTPTAIATKSVAVGLSGSLMQSLAAAKDAKPKVESKTRTEAWKRKPGEPVF
ncbi:MAG TPA: hypothetical protein VJ483_03685 [Holophagaceae bacterium]|nr:hypothetical protein [Holophagaceae bacterium]